MNADLKLSPNRVVVFSVVAFILYWILALFTPSVVLRDVFNSLAFGAQVIVVLTWGPAAWKAVKENAETGEWLLILAIFYICFVAMCQRLYTILFNFIGRPESWSDSAVTGFWPYSYMIAGLLFLMSPEVKPSGIRIQAWWSVFAAVGIGGLLAGVIIGSSLGPFF